MSNFATMSEEIRAALREDRLDDAHRLLTVAVEAARGASDPPALVQTLRALAQVERFLGRFEAALSLYDEAVDVCRRIGHGRLTAHTIRHRGDILRHLERYGEARPDYEEAVDLYASDPSSPPGDFANALRPMALLLEAVGEGDAAREHWRRALSLYDRAGIPPGVEECTAALARLSAE